MNNFEELDRKITLATQAGMPLCVEPYKEIAEGLNISEKLLLERMQVMQDSGLIRRVALVPNHYKLGYTFNGMTVWQVNPESCAKIGEIFSNLDYVSHCYKRKRYPGLWDYNVFAMIHGKNEAECDVYIKEMKELIKSELIKMETLYSSEILKKTGLRIKGKVDRV